MDWAGFKTNARQLNNQLPSVRRIVYAGEPAAEALNGVRSQIANLRIDLDDLRFGNKRDSLAVSTEDLDQLGTALDEARECIEVFGQILEDDANPKRAGMRRGRRPLEDKASQRTKTYAALTHLNSQLSDVLDHPGSQGIPSGRTRRPEVRATVTDLKSQDHRKRA